MENFFADVHRPMYENIPERAYAWELRLQDEIAADFTIDEADTEAQQDMPDGEESDDD